MNSYELHGVMPSFERSFRNPLMNANAESVFQCIDQKALAFSRRSLFWRVFGPTVASLLFAISGCGLLRDTVSPGPRDTTESYHDDFGLNITCLLYTSPSPRDVEESRMPSSA